MIPTNQVINRWRLLLGKYADEDLALSNSVFEEMDSLLEFLYGREYSESRGIRGEGDRVGGEGPSLLEVPNWIQKVRKLFPKETVEVLEKHALQKYNLKELLADAKILEKLEPNLTLMKSILQIKHLMNNEVLDAARKVVHKVVEEIRKQLETSVRNAILGKIDRKSSGFLKGSRNLDLKKTIHKNLKNYDRENQQLCVEQVYYFRNIRNFIPWRIVLVIDQSGSMLDSVIHSAVMAGIFAGLPALKVSLVVFDTEVVDLSEYVSDPVEILMQVQLGGGTYIHKALQYGYSLIQHPARTIFILLSDLYEGCPPASMYKWTADIIESGAKMIVLTALDQTAEPNYDKKAGETMAQLGADVAAITPEKLGQWISRLIS